MLQTKVNVSFYSNNIKSKNNIQVMFGVLIYASIPYHTISYQTLTGGYIIHRSKTLAYKSHKMV